MNRGGLRLALVVVVVLCAVAAAPASAARTELSAGRGLGAPRLAGTSVVAFAGSGSRVVRVDPDGSRTTLRELERPARAQRYDAGFAASASHVAVARFYEVESARGSESSFRLEAGPLGGPLRQLFDCPGDHVFDVDGSRIAYIADACTDGPGAEGRIVVRDLSVDGAPVVRSAETRRGASTLLPLDLAGDHVAYGAFATTEPRIAVIDLVSGAEAYGFTGRYGAGYSLQSDGKLAVGRGQDCVIDWFSKAEPVAHTLELCPSGGLRLRDDRIALVRPGARGAALEIVSLDGVRRPIARIEPRAAVGGFDFDGARVAYVARGCVEANSRLFVDDLEGGPVPVEGGACIGTLVPRTVRSSDTGLLRVRVRCPEGCSGSLELFNTGRRTSERPARFAFAGVEKTISIRLKARTRRQVRRFGSMVMKAPLSVRQRDGSFRSYGVPLNVLAPK